MFGMNSDDKRLGYYKQLCWYMVLGEVVEKVYIGIIVKGVQLGIVGW